MSAIYLDEPGLHLCKKTGCFRVEKDDTVLAEIPETQLDRLVICGNVAMTTPVIAFLLDKAVPTTFISSHGRYRGELVSNHTRNITLRLEQFRRYEDSKFRLNLSRKIVSAKLHNSVQQLARHQRNHPETDLTTETTEISNTLRSMESAQNLDALRGYEGIVAKWYFQALGRMVRKEFSFTERSRRPPKDPVNALLSLGYTLLYSEIFSALAANGFDPYLGFFHEIEYGRPSLAVDMMEEFRWLIDGLVLTLVNKEILKKTDFKDEGEKGVYLNEPARKTFYGQYETRLREMVKYEKTGETVNYRRIFFYQAQLLAQVVQNKDRAYEPFLIR